MYLYYIRPYKLRLCAKTTLSAIWLAMVLGSPSNEIAYSRGGRTKPIKPARSSKTTHVSSSTQGGT